MVFLEPCLEPGDFPKIPWQLHNGKCSSAISKARMKLVVLQMSSTELCFFVGVGEFACNGALLESQQCDG